MQAHGDGIGALSCPSQVVRVSGELQELVQPWGGTGAASASTTSPAPSALGGCGTALLQRQRLGGFCGKAGSQERFE